MAESGPETTEVSDKQDLQPSDRLLTAAAATFVSLSCAPVGITALSPPAATLNGKVLEESESQARELRIREPHGGGVRRREVESD